MTNTPIVFEFLGAPGVGKTTLARMLSKELKDVVEGNLIKSQKNKYKRIFYKSFLFGKHTLFHPILSSHIIKTIISSKQESWKDVAKIIFNHVYLMGLYDTFKSGKTILDQGLAQSVWSVKLKARRNLTDMDKLLFTKDLKVIYIYIDAGFKDIVSRLENREGYNSRVEKDSKLMNLNLNKNFDEINKFIKNKKHVNTIQIDNSNSLEDSFQQLITCLSHIDNNIIK